jgi:hypothetical protein
MTAAFIETTVLTDFLLKRDGTEIRAAAAFARCDDSIIPQFAWKEFKRGPLKNFVWAHNKLADTRSLLTALAALQRLSRSPQRYLTSTAIQAIHTAFANLFTDLPALTQKYGAKANPDAIYADALRLELKRVILSSWKNRATLFGGPSHILSCYPDAQLRQDATLIKIEPRDCPSDSQCCLKDAIIKRPKDLVAIRQSLKSETDRQEVARRVKVIKQLEKHPTSLMRPQDCRAFGDAYFVLFCPEKSVVLTTNRRDIEPMASVLKIAVETP